MIHERNLERVLRSWVDEGADLAPERFVWSALEAVEKTSQRGAWQASLEGLIVKLKHAAPILGVAAAIVIALAAYQLIGGRNVGEVGGPSLQSTPRAITAEDLPNIVLTTANAPEGFTIDNTDVGAAALLVPLKPSGPMIDQTAFVDALMNNLNSTETGGYVSWAALFETAADAEVAFDYVVDEHGPVGWRMLRSSVDPGLGDESATYTGPAYDIFETNIVHLWRVGNLVLAAVAVGDVAVGDANADQLLSLAELMDERAH
jgi:hypothetical protein